MADMSVTFVRSASAVGQAPREAALAFGDKGRGYAHSRSAVKPLEIAFAGAPPHVEGGG